MASRRGCGVQRSDFGCSKAVAVGEQGNGVVAFGVNGIEQVAHFKLREEADSGGCPAGGRCA
jgi:hypothetical protein